MTLFDKPTAGDTPLAFDQSPAFDQPVGFDYNALPADVDPAVATNQASANTAAKRPGRLAVSNWPVRWKVFAIALIPLVLAAVFGGLRIYDSAVAARDMRLAADRAQLVPAIDSYMGALETALFTATSPQDADAARTEFEARRTALLADRDRLDVVPDVRLAVTTITDHGLDLVNKSASGALNLPQRVTTFAPLLLTAETAITGSVRVDDEALRLKADGLARAVGTRGQMTIQRMMVDQGGTLPEPYVRSSMTALAGTEPSNVMGLASLLGNASDEAGQLRSEMVKRLGIMANPELPVVGSQELLASIDITDNIARKLIDSTTGQILDTADAEATTLRNNAIRDTAVVVVTFLVVLLIVWLMARSLTRPLRRLRDGALKIAHQDLASEIDRVKAGDEREPTPLPIYTTEEVGQVAHAVDELHTQALLLAGDEARLRVMVNDMFETLSRRNKTLVDQQLSLIDRLERNEENPDRLDSLFRLDHLATRMRRNGANLLVLAGAQVTREQAQPVPLGSLINAAASEVEDYQRVETGMVPDCSLVGAAAGDSVHLLAELIDNALRYSPPTAPVRVTAVHTSDAGVLIDVSDAGLGMTDSDLRIANMRLNAGGEVSADNTRHMGLFVVGRLARQHGMTVQLLPGVDGVGTVAQVYLPPVLLDGYAPPEVATEEPVQESFAGLDYLEPHVEEPEAGAAETPEEPDEFGSADEAAPDRAAPDEADTDEAVALLEPEPEPAGDAPEASVTVLPRRSPGSSGIAGESAGQPFGETQESRDWWSENQNQPEAETPSNTAGFFASRRRLRQENTRRQQEPEPVAEAPEASEPAQGTAEPQTPAELESPAEAESVGEPGEGGEPLARAADTEVPEPDTEVPEPDTEVAEPGADDETIDLSDMGRLADELSPHRTASGVDLIYQNMVTEWLDPSEVQQLAVPQDWKSVWDNGWAAAEEAENRPIEARTDHGLPVRAPGARLVPGGAPPSGGEPEQAGGEESEPHTEDQGELAERDPDAIRASMSNHFSGVRAARLRARNTTQGHDAL